MKCRRSTVLFLLILWDVVGLVIFLRGFLVVKTAVPGHGNLEKQRSEPITQPEDGDDIRRRPPYDRLVLVVIDALRSDFVLADQRSDLPKMKNLASLAAQGKALSFLAKSHPPTVTLPRIKALTSGGVPGFVDVIMNFDSKKCEEDNLIGQMKRAGRQIVFYGDDTWMQLFPGHFVRSEGTTSFFITDYTEVDNNVTHHLEEELRAGDWDAMVLHYLGLDHIGHLAGPRSPLVPTKLQEMDDIVKEIFNAVTHQDTTSSRSTLVVVCGDHGMRDEGGHGGSSHWETSTALVFLSQDLHSNGIPYDGATIDQVDLVPTLSLLLGLPIPQNSLGVVIHSVLNRSWNGTQERLQALHINAQQLMAVFAFNFKNYENEPPYLELQRAIRSHENWLKDHRRNQNVDAEHLGEKVLKQYYSALYKMRDRLTASCISYDTHAMRFGVATLCLVLLVLLYLIPRNNDLLDLSFAPTGVLTFMSLLGLMSSAHFLECLGPEASPLLCAPGLVTMAATVVWVVAASFWITVLVSQIFYFRAPATSKLCLPETLVGKWLMATVVCHGISLLASSFVEEEHQTSYFVASTSVVFILVQTFVRVVPGQEDVKTFHPEPCMAMLHENVFNKRTENVLPQRKGVRSPASSNPTGRSRGVDWRVTLLGVSTVVLVRVLRGWNRTGDKWAHLPDVGDWLVLPDNKPYLSLFCFGGLVCSSVVVLFKKHHVIFKVVFAIGSFMVYYFRAATGVLIVPFTSQDVSKGITEARAVYAVLLILLLLTLWQYHREKTSEVLCDQLKCVWVLLMLLLLRPHNIPLVAMMFVLQEVIGRLVSLAHLTHWNIVLLYYWFGQVSFFSQGNSNSISTVDVSAGYLGLSEYQPFLIGLLMCLSTYAGPVFWMLSLAHQWTASVKETSSSKSLVTACSVLWLTRALPLAVCTVQVVFQQNHLFLWTVFSPKLLYEGMHTLVMAAVVLLCLGMHSLHS